jgi:hypothetical protein
VPRARHLPALVTVVSFACAGPRLQLSSGTKAQGEIPDIRCNVLSYREPPYWCSPSEPRLVIHAYSDCSTTGALEVAISKPPASRASDRVPAMLPLKVWTSVTGPCFKRPPTGTEVVVSVEGICATGAKIAGTTTCVMPP